MKSSGQRLSGASSPPEAGRPASASKGREKGPKEPLRLALVDDEKYVRASLPRMIAATACGWTVDTYASAQEALEKIPSSVVDLVLMDIDMPGMSGLDCVGKLKRILPALPVVMISAYFRAGEVLQAKQLGVNGFLTKPVEDPEWLVAMLRSAWQGGVVFSWEAQEELVKQSAALLRQGRPSKPVPILSPRNLGKENDNDRSNQAPTQNAPPPLSQEPVTASRSRQVALVGDDEAGLKAIGAQLASSPIRCGVKTYSTVGQLLHSILPSETPAAIFIHFNRHQDVLSCLERLRTGVPHVPTIVLSGLTDRKSILSCLTLEASGYLTLPLPVGEATRAVLRVGAGLSAFCPEAERLLGECLRRVSAFRANPANKNLGLSRCESEVLACALNGYCEKDIADALRIDCRTVSAYKLRIQDKMRKQSE